MMTRWRIPLILGLAGAAIAVLVFAGVRSNDLYMTTLDQWDPARAQRADLRVAGFVKDGTIEVHPERVQTAFVMRNETGDRSVPVVFSGVTPGLFRDGTSVVVSGRLGEDGVFAARELMTKCPSKYEGMESPHQETPPGTTVTAQPAAAAVPTPGQ